MYCKREFKVGIEKRFRQEADELIVDLEAAILKLEEHPESRDCIDRAFRTMHTIKGTGEMFGYEKLAEFSHHLESAFEMVRSGEIHISEELISIFLDSADHMRSMLSDKQPSQDIENNSRRIVSRIFSLISSYAESPQNSNDSRETDQQRSDEKNINQTYRIRIRPLENAFSEIVDPLYFLREIALLGPCHVTTLTCDVPEIDALDSDRCYLQWDVILTTDRSESLIDHKLEIIKDSWLVDIEVLDAGGHWSDSPDDKPLGEILVERGDATPEQIELAKSQQKKIGEILSEKIHISPDKIEAALQEQEAVRQAQAQRQLCENSSNVRVSVSKLDSLIELVGELAVAQSRLSEYLTRTHDPSLINIIDDMERISIDLRDNSLALRMLPVGSTFSGCRRLIRDLSVKLGKKVQFLSQGAEIELDKCVIERINETLLHLVRNSMDHGIETPERRREKGKPEQGVITLNIFYSLSSVVITIHDDGAGLDAQKIRRRAVDLGLIDEGEKVSNQTLFNLIFQPGFTTAEVISEVSGRGIGMDIVKNAIESLRGKISIDSSPKHGSTVTIVIPQTLAFIESLIVRVDTKQYVFPLTLVEQCIDLSTVPSTIRDTHVIDSAGNEIPYMKLHDLFDHRSTEVAQGQVVVVKIGDTDFGFNVDDIVGRQQTIIKGLGKDYRGQKGLAGETVLNNGESAYILDTFDLVNNHSTERKTLH